ncbi:hypothetical protein D9K79_04165 [Acinetobacter cumulans]|jgi:hypothetical protein|uniref:Uncharacterized protein n=1 Tax=Acinetobacter cumulans TaxID=2136182 RepID=A0ABX9UAF2_9GAMM|nr:MULTISPECIES: hypothetical protein [Acinetobacter]NWK73643.1 hypothetical protein [Acinetobacter sp. SwsAc6]QCO22454.1 hypothetical protein C9E88_013620 [Acinetobacter cumulans]RFS29811.1 hypothetical protein DYI81_11395 [Acinetobacter sp. SWAC5]RKG46649.1 hypothetical protein D7V51_00260 [Acinetobacter cumulans]RKG46971.1 hypothetical protein D7V68_13555 [Acinetobacter cumulans]
MTIPKNKPALDGLQNIEVQDNEQLEQEQKQSDSADWTSSIDVIEIAKGAVDIVGDLISGIDLNI